MKKIESTASCKFYASFDMACPLCMTKVPAGQEHCCSMVKYMPVGKSHSRKKKAAGRSAGGAA